MVRRYLRFSLQSLLFFVIALGSLATLIVQWPAWRLSEVIENPGKPYERDDGMYVDTGLKSGIAKVCARDGRVISTLKGHSKPIDQCDISPDGTRAATGSEDMTLKTWEVSSGKLLQSRELSDNAYSLSYSPDGKQLMAMIRDTVHVMDSTTLKDNFTWVDTDISAADPPTFYPEGWIVAISVGPSLTPGPGPLVAPYTIQLRNTRTGKIENSFTGHTHRVVVVRISPDRKWMASGGYDNLAILFDMKTGTERFRLPHPGSVVDCIFSNDSKVLATSGNDYKVRLWDRETAELLAELSIPLFTHRHPDAIVFDNEGKLIIYGGAGLGQEYVKPKVFVFERHRPERWYGVLTLPPFWLLVASVIAFARSYRIDLKRQTV